MKIYHHNNTTPYNLMYDMLWLRWWVENNNYWGDDRSSLIILNIQNMISKFDRIQKIIRMLFYFKKNKLMYSPNNLAGKYTKQQLWKLITQVNYNLKS
jgi:hypothetical protein